MSWRKRQRLFKLWRVPFDSSTNTRGQRLQSDVNGLRRKRKNERFRWSFFWSCDVIALPIDVDGIANSACAALNYFTPSTMCVAPGPIVPIRRSPLRRFLGRAVSSFQALEPLRRNGVLNYLILCDGWFALRLHMQRPCTQVEVGESTVRMWFNKRVVRKFCLSF